MRYATPVSFTVENCGQVQSHTSQCIHYPVSEYFPELYQKLNVRPYHHIKKWAYMCELILCSLLHIMWSWCEGECLNCWRNTAAGCGCPNCLSSIATCSVRICILVQWSTWRNGKTSAWLVTLCVCLSSSPSVNVIFLFSADVLIELATILFCIWQKVFIYALKLLFAAFYGLCRLRSLPSPANLTILSTLLCLQNLPSVLWQHPPP